MSADNKIEVGVDAFECAGADPEFPDKPKTVGKIIQITDPQKKRPIIIKYCNNLTANRGCAASVLGRQCVIGDAIDRAKGEADLAEYVQLDIVLR
jgi:hypothetical protein